MNIIDTPIQPISLFLRSSSYSQALNTTKTNLIFELNETITNYQNMDILVSCNSFQFTNSFYTINENNYKFIYKIYGSTPVIILIPFGFYDIDSLILKLNTLLSGIFIFSYNFLTYKITITHYSGLTFILLDDGTNKNIYEILGIDDNGFTTYTNNYICPYIFNLISIQVLHICIPNINIKSISLKDTIKYNIIASILVTSQFGQVQTYFQNNIFEYLINDNMISFINVQILNQDFNPVNFNNIDWFLNLSFKFIYKKSLNIPLSLEQFQKEYKHPDNEETTMEEELMNEENRNYFNSIINNF